MNSRTKKLTMVAMICAIAFVVTLISKVIPPIIGFLNYDPKDAIITIGGFIFGPFVAFVSTVIVSTIELFTISDTGLIGLAMNILGTVAFACVASYIYKKKHTVYGAILGLIVGSILMTIVMLLWNYFLTPIYMGLPREAVGAMLVPTFLPFNLIKAAINSSICMLIYKPIVKALRKANLIEKSKDAVKSTINLRGVIIVSLIVIASCVLFILQINGVI